MIQKENVENIPLISSSEEISLRMRYLNSLIGHRNFGSNSKCNKKALKSVFWLLFRELIVRGQGWKWGVLLESVSC